MNILVALAADATQEESIVTSLQQTLMFWRNVGFAGFLRNLLSGLLIILIGWFVLLALDKVLRSACRKSKNISDLMANYLVKIVSVIGWIIILATFLQHIGVNMGPLVAGLGVTGVVLGLAFQDSLTNFFSGVMIVVNQPFRTGDYIEVGDFSGTVVGMDLMCLTLRTPDGKKITMSNKVAWDSPITNYSFTTRRGVSMTIGVPYGADLEVCRQVFKDMLASYPEVLSDPVPIIEVSELADSSVNFLVRPWVAPSDYWAVNWRFNAEVVGKLAEKGIDVPFPQLDIHVDGALKEKQQ
jgi:small conductance mechanosensitive channel